MDFGLQVVTHRCVIAKRATVRGVQVPKFSQRCTALHAPAGRPRRSRWRGCPDTAMMSTAPRGGLGGASAGVRRCTCPYVRRAASRAARTPAHASQRLLEDEYDHHRAAEQQQQVDAQHRARALLILVRLVELGYRHADLVGRLLDVVVDAVEDGALVDDEDLDLLEDLGELGDILRHLRAGQLSRGARADARRVVRGSARLQATDDGWN